MKSLRVIITYYVFLYCIAKGWYNRSGSRQDQSENNNNSQWEEFHSVWQLHQQRNVVCVCAHQEQMMLSGQKAHAATAASLPHISATWNVKNFKNLHHKQ